MIVLTVACPEALIGDANDLAMVLALGPDDGATYRLNGWQDASGTRYAVTSFPARPEWMAGAQDALQRPDWDTPDNGYTISMAAAERAQALLHIVTDPADRLARPDRITILPGEEALAGIAAMGLARVPDDDA